MACTPRDPSERPKTEREAITLRSLGLFVFVCFVGCSPPPSAVVVKAPKDGKPLDAGVPRPDAGHDGGVDAGPPDGAVVADLPAPRLIAPLSTATVTSQQPTLRWIRANGTDSVHVQ